MSLQTRRPTGEAGWPSILVEGGPGARKTSTCLALSNSPQVGRTYVIEVGEDRADEYAALGDFDLVIHDGTLRGIVGAIWDVMALAPFEGRPNLLVIDSLSAVWTLVKQEARALARASEQAKKLLQKDPLAEVPVGHQAWENAEEPFWWAWINELRRWPGIALLTVRAEERVMYVDDLPAAGHIDYRLDMKSSARFAVDAQVRVRGADSPLVVYAKSTRFSVPAGGLVLPDDDALAHLVFERFEASPSVALDRHRAQHAMAAHLRGHGLDGEPAKEIARGVWERHSPGVFAFSGPAMAAVLADLDAAVDALTTPEPAAPQPQFEPVQ